MSVVTKTYYCPKHPTVSVGQEREVTIFLGLHDNGEDYGIETDSDFWPCLVCEEDRQSRTVKSVCKYCNRTFEWPEDEAAEFLAAHQADCSQYAMMEYRAEMGSASDRDFEE